MNLATSRTLAAIGAVLAALTLAGGFARGAWFGTVHAYDAAEAGAPAAIAAPRDPQAALAALGAHRHWGEYRPPPTQNVHRRRSPALPATRSRATSCWSGSAAMGPGARRCCCRAATRLPPATR